MVMPNSLDREARFRADFEAWATSKDYSLQRRDTGEYRFVSTANAWLGWQAGAAAATERAAKICEDIAAPEGMHGTAVSIWDVATLDCAEAIIRDRSAP